MVLRRGLTLTILTAALSFSSSLVNCTLVSDPASLTQTEYDFIIVGAGITGSVLAYRLTEISNVSVLLIEAGVSNTNDITDEVPFLSSDMANNSPLNWNDTTTAQVGLNGRNVSYPRGHVLGGGSTINHLVWTRGSVDDYNRYANVTGDDGWSWDNMFPYFRKSEDMVAPRDDHNTTGEYEPDVHGYSGPLQISLPGYPSSIDYRVIATTKELADTFPYNIDVNSGYPIGVGWLQSAVDSDGRRSSAATAYLEPALQRANLDVLMGTQVTKLIVSTTNSSNGAPSFTEVQVAKSVSSTPTTVRANNEVILSAGSIGTAQILLLSGIGDPEALAAVNVTSTLNLTDVGQNLADHPLIYTNWIVDSTGTDDELARNTTLQAEWLVQWNTSGTGLYVDNTGNQIGFLRMNETLLAANGLADPSAGINSPHIEMVPGNGFFGSTPATGNYLGILTYALTPASRGSVTLASNNPFEAPLIDPGLLTEPFDVFALVESLKLSRQFLSAPTWTGYVVEPYGALASATTDTELEALVRENAEAGYHPIGTARMAAESSSDGVVNPDLLVKGASGLRVVDASVLPYLTSSHLQACMYALGERAADLIKETWGY